MNKHLISEVFYSIQGEGKYTGVPTAWVRFFQCNLQCNGFGQKDPTDPTTHILPYKDFDPTTVNRIEDLPVWKYGCDSSYSWAAKFKHLQHQKNAAEIADMVEACLKNEWNPEGKFLHPASLQEQHLCFTGGEPMLAKAQTAMSEIILELYNRNNFPRSMTIESNGTQPITDDLIRIVNTNKLFFSVSPKLFTVSGEKNDKAIKPEIVSEYAYYFDGQLKFVMGSEERQWDELDRVIDQFRDHDVLWPAWIMPVGATLEGQHGEYGGHAPCGKVAEMAYKRGYNVSPRVHVDLWGNVIGV